MFFSCKKTTEQTVQNINVTINNCSSISTNANTNFSICYDSLLFDNRCPDLAMCARRGEVGVKLLFKQSNSTIPFKLADFPNPIGNFPTDTTINGVHIRLVDVLPHPPISNNSNANIMLEIN